MLLNITSSFFTWLSQLFTVISNNITRLQPSQYAVGLVVVICMGYMLLRGRD